jgi:hypothetical protein
MPARLDPLCQLFMHELPSKWKSRRERPRRLNIWRLDVVENINLLLLLLVIVIIKVRYYGANATTLHITETRVGHHMIGGVM